MSFQGRSHMTGLTHTPLADENSVFAEGSSRKSESHSINLHTSIMLVKLCLTVKQECVWMQLA